MHSIISAKIHMCREMSGGKVNDITAPIIVAIYSMSFMLYITDVMLDTLIIHILRRKAACIYMKVSTFNVQEWERFVWM